MQREYTFGIGCCTGELVDWGYFILSKEISIIDALSLFLTIGCAVYVAKVLEKDVQDDRIEKDIFLEQLEHIEHPVTEIDELLYLDKKSYHDIVSAYSKSNVARNKFFRFLARYKKNLANDADVKACQEALKSKLRELKPLLTETPVAGDNSNDIKVVRGKISYSVARSAEIANILQSIHDDLFKLKIYVNRC